MPELEIIFAEALELQDPAEQRDYLNGACRENTLLRNRVGALIDANRQAASFMSEPAGVFDLEDFESSSSPAIGEQPGDTVGRYQLVEQVGEGGMGTVFRARQTEPIQREVALKVVKPGLDTKEVVARFESERQALALMDHPNIARAYDAGATPSGRPYFVMEYVPGQSISEYCNEQQLTTRERLELFIPVCEAIQHAHQKGIIHRDIKPHNVLITNSAGKAAPKVIDFGIAKAIDRRLTDKTLETRLGQFIGTPAYMSPEQADSTTVDVDTRSDVYSLGATLYELLAGVAPFEQLKTHSNEEICRVIREETPIQPSAAVSTNKDAAATAIATARRATPAELQSAIRGDLDWIVMRALEKEPNRRYPTATALADDIRRYLQNEEVVARPPTVGYRLRKFVARNRLAVAAAVIVASTLVLATCLSSAFAVWAMQSRDLAHRKTASLQEVVDFMDDGLFAQASPLHEPNPDVTLRFVLDRASQRLANDRHELRPDVEVAVRTTLGQTYRSLGEYRESLIHLRRAHALSAETMGPSDVRTAEAGNELAESLLRLAKFEEAKSYLDKSALIAQESKDSELLLQTKRLNASYCNATGKLSVAEELLTEILTQREIEFGSNHTETLEALADVAFVYGSQGRHDEALPMLERALAGLWNEEEWHPDALRVMVSLAKLHASRGDLDQAELLYADAVRHLQFFLGEDHSQTLSAMHGLALVHRSRNRFSEAEPLLQEVLVSQKKQLGDRHPSTLNTMRTLAGLLSNMDRAEQAQELYQDHLTACRETYGPDHETAQNSLSTLAFFHMDQAQFGPAIPYYQELAVSFRKTSGNTDTRAMIAQTMLGLCRHKSANHELAKTDLETALNDCVEAFPHDWLRPVIEGQLGEVYLSLEQREAAENSLLRSYERLQECKDELPMRWRPLGLRAVTRRLAEFYESSARTEHRILAREYRTEYEQICTIDSKQNEVKRKEDGDSN